VGDGIVQVRPRFRTLAVDVSSGVEATTSEGVLRKGVKDPARIHQFVAAVRAADALLARSPHALLSTT
jgi:phosphoribosylanthranilate isomerase